MIKKYLKYAFTLFIIGLSTINLSNAQAVETIGEYFGQEVFPTIYEVKVSSNGNVFSKYKNIQYELFAIGHKAYWRWNNGRPYFYNSYNSTLYQGYVKNYAICDEITNTNLKNLPLNCEYNNIEENFNFGDFLSNLVNTDYYYYNRRGYEGMYFCYSSSVLHKSLCIGFDPNSSYGGQFTNNLTGSLNIGQSKTPDQIDSEYLENAPIGNTNGGEEEGGITIRTGNNYYCPTFGQLLEMQPSNYNTGLCYNGTLKYENGQITTIQQQDIQTVFTDYEEYQQYIYLYNNYCTGPATQQTCENVFNGEREKYSIIANAMKNNVDNKELWNYCNIWLNYDLNTTTCVASGYIAEKPTRNELEEYILNIGGIGKIKTPKSGNILNNLLGSGETREDIATRDIFGQLDQIKEKISTIFNERNGVNGIIPDYILWLILTTLLLTVLLKK